MIRSRWFGGQQSSALALEPISLPVLSSADAKKFGLENFGNTCYANSVIQALYFCAPFRELLLQSVDPSITPQVLESRPPASPVPTPLTPVRRKPERKASTTGPPADFFSPPTAQSEVAPIPSSPPTLFSALRSLFVYISSQTKDKGTVAPRAFIDKLKEINETFRSTQHQDAHEFLNYLLNRIIEEESQLIKNGSSLVEDLSESLITLASKLPPTVITTSSSGTTPQSATLVHKLFEGVLTSETRCLTCETVSSRDESFLDLSIDIEQNASVTACLRQFSASEMLCHKNKFFCDSCCDLQEAEKRMKIKTLPNVLALHLKRFKYQEDLQKYIKLAYRVAFPFELRLFNTVDETQDADRLYNLFGIVVHIGNGPHHGHYISIIKTMGSWLVFDDDNVYPIQEADIPKYYGDSNSGSAYVLYYQAEDIDLASLGMRPPSPAATSEAGEVATGDLTGERMTASPSQQPIPLQPPGLEEGDSSDLSDPPFPITPSQSSPRLPLPDKASKMHLADEPLSNESTPMPIPPPAPIAQTPSTSKGKSLFGLKRAPSSSARPLSTGTVGDATRASFSADRTDRERSRTLPPAPALPGVEEPSTSLSALPLPPLPPPSPTKGMKEPERKSSWFKRKSFTRKVASESFEGPSSPIVSVSPAVDTQSPSLTSSPSWFRTTGQPPRRARTSHDGPVFDTPVYQTLSPSHHLPPTADDPNDRNSASSPSSSNLSVPLPPATTTLVPGVLDTVPPRTSSLSPLEIVPPSPQKGPEHKKSLSSLVQKTFGTSPSKSDMPTRPLPIPPVPPIPPPKIDTGFTVDEPRMSAEYVVLGPELGTLNGGLAESPLTSKTSISFPAENRSPVIPPPTNTVAKRASRKLSMTSPILGLGFGKKDKKEKEKATKGPPTSFGLTSRS